MVGNFVGFLQSIGTVRNLRYFLLWRIPGDLERKSESLGDELSFASSSPPFSLGGQLTHGSRPQTQGATASTSQAPAAQLAPFGHTPQSWPGRLWPCGVWRT